MGKIENQSVEIIGKNIGSGITLPILCDQENVNGELLTLHKSPRLSLFNIINCSVVFRMSKKTVELRIDSALRTRP